MKNVGLALILVSFSSFAVAAPQKSAKKPTAAAPTVSGRIESVTRQVEVLKAGGNGWKKAQNKAALSTDDKIRTGRRSVARVKLADGTKVLLLQNSQAEIENLSTVEKTIKLLRGRIRAIVAKVKGGNNFQIKTPVGVASVRGTDFEVGFDEESQEFNVGVKSGQVAVKGIGELAEEILLNPGDSIKFGPNGPLGEAIKSGALPLNSNDVRNELFDANKKNSIIAMAAEEARNADYQTGKSLIDVDGMRVRVDQYIMRPAANEFKLVVLNERPNRFDYFTYKGIFNQALPTDLSIALRQVGGKLGDTSPDYYLTAYETLASNTIDTMTDGASGGHLVRVTISPSDATKYRIFDVADTSNLTYRDIDIAALQSDGSYKIYNPLRDTFSLVPAADRDEAIKFSVLDTVSGMYRNFDTSDTLWKTRYNTYSSYINSTAKLGYTKKVAMANTLAIDLDANFTNAPITTISEFPSGTANLHNRLSLFYADGSKTTFDNYIIDDEGNIGESSVFSGKSTSAAYKEELQKWNYQQKVKATEMQGEINLVIDPRIGTYSGLIP